MARIIESPNPAAPRTARDISGMWQGRRPWLTLILLGIAARIAIVAIPGNRLRGPWSGGGDAPIYVLLAHNLLDGKGLSYALQPTAMRAPGYPLVLAGLMWIFRRKFVIAIRLIQFVLGLVTAYLCSRTASLLFGEKAARAALVVALFFPTLIFITGEVLTEAVAAFLAALFLFLAVRTFLKPRILLFAALGVLISLAALFHFNMAVLGFVGLWIAFTARASRPGWQRALVVCATAALTISPWVARNIVVFHGQAMYSTISGTDAVEGVVAPQGRALSYEASQIRKAEGWVHVDIETNAPSRLNFPAEPQLNRQAWTVAEALWRGYRWRLLPIEAAKCSYFWLSTDQVFFTGSFPLRERIFRWGGVLSYWALLALGVAGWGLTWQKHPTLARCFILYAVIVTVLHLPFAMMTRLRIPLMDPLLATLGGAFLGCLSVRTPPR